MRGGWGVLWVVEALLILYQVCRFMCNLSFVTLFEVRFKALDSWCITLSCNNSLDINYVHKNMNDVF